MQPFSNYTNLSSVCVFGFLLSIIYESIFTYPKSLTITPTFFYSHFYRKLFIKVVFPAPKKPVIIVIGTLFSWFIVIFLYIEFWITIKSYTDQN